MIAGLIEPSGTWLWFFGHRLLRSNCTQLFYLERFAPPQYFEKPNHIRIFERDVFVSLIESAGLQILRREYWGFYSVFDWVLHWFDDPEVDVTWAKLWTRLLDGKRGMATKRVLDQNIAKSQSIIARKPAGS